MAEAAGNVKVELITRREIIDVRHGVMRVNPDHIKVEVCLICGAVVFDPVQHDLWHRSVTGG